MKKIGMNIGAVIGQQQEILEILYLNDVGYQLVNVKIYRKQKMKDIKCI